MTQGDGVTYYPPRTRAADDYREMTRLRAENAELVALLDRAMAFFGSDPRHTEPPDGLGVEIGEALGRIRGDV